VQLCHSVARAVKDERLCAVDTGNYHKTLVEGRIAAITNKFVDVLLIVVLVALLASDINVASMVRLASASARSKKTPTMMNVLWS
jgi:hypothetical protein